MTVVKRMTAKGDFLKMPLEDRKCEVETYEDCRTRRLIEECNCIPWELPSSQVGNDKKFKTNKTNFQETPKCSPKGRDCIEQNSTRTFDCRVNCEGIYADVEWMDERMEDEVIQNDDNMVYNSILEVRFAHIYKTIQHLQKEIDMIKGKRGDELDKEKYRRLISEYKEFKKNNVQQFRFDAKNFTNYGKFASSSLPVLSKHLKERSMLSFRSCVSHTFLSLSTAPIGRGTAATW